MDPSLTTIYESHSGTVYPLNAIASSSMSPLMSPQDEHSSRMRSHKGNRPSLPQSKHCPLCPAKFTRTTHLNRHLRTHTNERLHRCDTCLSEFTRSDLLTRHKRSCGDLLNQNKSRRKSCQACAESKVKCDLKQPCTKCTSRGKECIFINDPAQSREKKAAAAARRKAAQKAAADASSISSASPRLTPPSCGPMLYSSGYSYDVDEETELSLVSSISSAASAFDLSPISPTELLYEPSSSYSTTCPELSGSTTTSSSMSPRSDLFDIAADYYAAGPEVHMLDESLSKIMPQEIVPVYPESSFAMHPHDFVHSSHGLLDFGYEAQPQWMMDSVLTACSPLDVDSYIAPLSGDVTSTGVGLLNGSAPSSLLVTRETSPVDMSPKGTSVGPAEAELQHYLYLFHTMFQSHVPIVHSSDWTFEGKTPFLTCAMQACGAQFVKTPVAKDFVSQTLQSTRESLLRMVKSPTESDEMMDVILAGLLVQGISLFRLTIDQRPAAGHFHGMLIMMIRRCGFINAYSSWTPPDLSVADATQIEAAWRNWIAHESMKRLLTLAYVHDCFLNVFLSLSPSFFASELDWCLPSEDALWNATSSQEWYLLLQQPSPYGSVATRLTGLGIRPALAVLGDMRMPTPPLALSPFAYFVLINSTLSSIFSPSDMQGARVTHAESALDHLDSPGSKPHDFVLQYTLHNWLQGWIGASDGPTAEKVAQEPRFTRNAMPYYWLAQASLVALQEDISGKPGFFVTPDARFRVLGQWLLHIQAFLRSGQSDTTGLWIDLMKIVAEDGHGASTGTGAEGMEALRPDL
ncbi:hypothetical protein B0F90DRAFT_1916398 [Multifurca ochricompacta]|uniref:Uncharacterized protein n=1 Tax=Multifurca ochricompacta TaxID=376703 RepID=A0AAD4M7F6_9AGAM|nr:hypothetical protein B0F90DRAFT_1916398 [Multifurca ochricompacta]